MKNNVLLLALLMLPVALLASEEKKPAAEPRAGSAAMTLPAGATEVEPNTYRYTDPQGKAWTYRRTPFGLARFEDKPVEAPAKAAPEKIRAVDDGDSVRFERSYPFGTTRWTRKKSELSDVERNAWDEARQKRTAGAKAAGTE